MKKLVLLIFIAVFSLVKSQLGGTKEQWTLITLLAGTRIELTSIDQKGFLSFGTKLPINEKNYIGIKGHFNWWDLPGRKFIVIPELDYFRKVTSFKDDSIITSIYAGTGLNPYSVSPKLGTSFYHIFSVELGYDIEYNSYKHFPMRGFRYCLGFNIVF